MADLGGQRNRNYRPYGPASNTQRDAAFNDIFGGVPQGGRSQTMNSQTPQFSQGRAHTMSSHTVQPQFQRMPPPPTRQVPNGYGPPPSAPPNGYPPPPPSGQYQAYNPAAGSGAATMSSQPPQQPRPYPGAGDVSLILDPNAWILDQARHPNMRIRGTWVGRCPLQP
ncbi:hypothetical protein N7509_005708 [Penicillium cosmopolitanum]|uniref:Uncharacterized protein n=1 Tax=Penicillium cosmopolitanum TaxID=1131564 RepID=A0A9W9W2Q8_9EURO|nr:uncharacterized protein N7509_005708 [Penicillium cosmopolitanum]KAJ5397595.1 hypothetical protein N7509_005708 [Penicillium cosmopolitanum]